MKKEDIQIVKILAIDDKPDNLVVISALLKKNPGD